MIQPQLHQPKLLKENFFGKGEDGDGNIVGEDVITNDPDMCIVSNSGDGYTLIAKDDDKWLHVF